MPRVAATAAFRDEMRDKADRPESSVPSGFDAMASSALLRGLRIGTGYSLRPQLANEA
jgi:hypothetical protein